MFCYLAGGLGFQSHKMFNQYFSNLSNVFKNIFLIVLQFNSYLHQFHSFFLYTCTFFSVYIYRIIYIKYSYFKISLKNLCVKVMYETVLKHLKKLAIWRKIHAKNNKNFNPSDHDADALPLNYFGCLVYNVLKSLTLGYRLIVCASYNK